MKKLTTALILFFTVFLIAGCSASNAKSSSVSSDQKDFITEQINNDAKSMFGFKPDKLTFSSNYVHKDRGINVKVKFSDKQVQESDMLKNNPKLDKDNAIKLYIDLIDKGSTQSNKEAVQDEFNQELGRDSVIGLFNNNSDIQELFISDDSGITSNSSYDIEMDSQANVNYLIKNYNNIKSMSATERVKFLDTLPKQDHLKTNISIQPKQSTDKAGEQTLIERTIDLDNVPNGTTVNVKKSTDNSKADVFTIKSGKVTFKTTNTTN
jgi:hypothetical protein